MERFAQIIEQRNHLLNVKRPTLYQKDPNPPNATRYYQIRNKLSLETEASPILDYIIIKTSPITKIKKEVNEMSRPYYTLDTHSQQPTNRNGFASPKMIFAERAAHYPHLNQPANQEKIYVPERARKHENRPNIFLPEININTPKKQKLPIYSNTPTNSDTNKHRDCVSHRNNYKYEILQPRSTNITPIKERPQLAYAYKQNLNEMKIIANHEDHNIANHENDYPKNQYLQRQSTESSRNDSHTTLTSIMNSKKNINYSFDDFMTYQTVLDTEEAIKEIVDKQVNDTSQKIKFLKSKFMEGKKRKFMFRLGDKF